MKFDLDSEMVFSNISTGSEPMVFMPDIDWADFEQSSIIDAF